MEKERESEEEEYLKHLRNTKPLFIDSILRISLHDFLSTEKEYWENFPFIDVGGEKYNIFPVERKEIEYNEEEHKFEMEYKFEVWKNDDEESIAELKYSARKEELSIDGYVDEKELEHYQMALEIFLDRKGVPVRNTELLEENEERDV